MNKVSILTGPIKSGKTTNLLKWISLQQNIKGIFSPVIDDKRYLKDIDSHETRLMESDESTPVEYILPVGRYSFDKRIFDWGRNVISAALYLKPEILVIDEIGHLELNGKGFEPLITEIISRIDEYPETKFLCVVRDFLVAEFHSHFNLIGSETTIITVDELSRLRLK